MKPQNREKISISIKKWKIYGDLEEEDPDIISIDSNGYLNKFQHYQNLSFLSEVNM